MRSLLPLSLSVLGRRRRRRLRVLWPKVPVVEVVGQSDAEVVEDVRVGRQDAGKIAEVGNVVLLRAVVRRHLVAEEEHERSLAPQTAMLSLEIETCFRVDFAYCVSQAVASFPGNRMPYLHIGMAGILAQPVP